MEDATAILLAFVRCIIFKEVIYFYFQKINLFALNMKSEQKSLLFDMFCRIVLIKFMDSALYSRFSPKFFASFGDSCYMKKKSYKSYILENTEYNIINISFYNFEQ